VSEPTLDLEPLPDDLVLDTIAAVMHAHEWTADLLDVIAAMVRLSGREVGDLD
jgi:hypothetical protein